MIRRLLAQFGFAALALALAGSGAALADSATSPTTSPGDTAQQADQSVVNVQTADGSTVQVQTSQTAQQAVGAASSDGDHSGHSGSGSGGSANLGSGGGSGSGNQASGGATNDSNPGTYSSSDSTANALTPAAGSGSSAGPSSGSGSSLAAAGSTSAGGGSGGSATPSPSSGPPQALVESWHQVVARMAAQPHPPVLQATAAPNEPQSPSVPGTPHSPTGFFLSQLPLLLQQVVVPVARGGAPAAAIAQGLPALPLALILLSLIALGAVRRQPPVNSYTAGLRRSGFLGAARSDIGGITSFFATPREMGCIFAPAT